MRLVVDELILVIPAVESTDLLADNLRRMAGSLLSESVEVNLMRIFGHVKQEVLSKGTVLNVRENLLHSFSGFIGNDLRAGDIVAVLSGVGDGVAHSGEAALIDEVDDELHLMDALEVSVSRVVASFAEGVKTSLHLAPPMAAAYARPTSQVSPL